MPRIVITHAVQNVERWLGSKAERAAALPGATNVTDLVAVDGSNHTAVAFDFDDLGALKAVLSSMPPEMAAQAESHGVIMPLTVYVEAYGGQLASVRFRDITSRGSPAAVDLALVRLDGSYAEEKATWQSK